MAKDPLGAEVSLSLRVCTQRSLHDADFDNAFLPFLIKGKSEVVGHCLIGDESSELTEKTVVLGECRFFVVRLNAAIKARRDTYMFFDSTEALAEYMPLLGEGCDDFADSILRTFPHLAEQFPRDLLLVDRVVLHPCIRGKGVTGAIFRRLIEEQEARNPMVVLKPFPLQFCRDLLTKEQRISYKLDALPVNFEEGERKLCEHYRKLGFSSIDGIDFMLADPGRARLKTRKLPAYLNIPVSKLP